MIRDPHTRILNQLEKRGYDINNKSYGESFFDDSIFKLLEENLNNEKGGVSNPEDYFSRYRDIISDPNNLFIQRVQDAGKIDGELITLHNGIKLFANYYGNFIKILKYNLGVHEPSEERAFSKVLNVLKEGSNMIELGSYWSMYSVWFSKTIKNSKSYCIEIDTNNMNLGIKNFLLNNLTPNFFQGNVSTHGFNLMKFLNEQNINHLDVLHSDIQGNEFEMLNDISNFLLETRIKYLFISTHSNYIHSQCKNFLNSVGYKILCSCDFDHESFQFDGFILSCPNNLNEIKEFEVGNRIRTPLISNEELNNIIRL